MGGGGAGKRLCSEGFERGSGKAKLAGRAAGARPTGNHTADLTVVGRLHFHSTTDRSGMQGAPHCL